MIAERNFGENYEENFEDNFFAQFWRQFGAKFSGQCNFLTMFKTIISQKFEDNFEEVIWSLRIKNFLNQDSKQDSILVNHPFSSVLFLHPSAVTRLRLHSQP